jgi:hypothetical protein
MAFNLITCPSVKTNGSISGGAPSPAITASKVLETNIVPLSTSAGRGVSPVAMAEMQIPHMCPDQIIAICTPVSKCEQHMHKNSIKLCSTAVVLSMQNNNHVK